MQRYIVRDQHEAATTLSVNSLVTARVFTAIVLVAYH